MLPITITSAILFPENLKSVVQSKLSDKFPLASGFFYEVDKTLIAGFQVKYGDTELHYDLKSEIEFIQNELV